MTAETVFRNARIALDEGVVHGSVLIRDGLIADVSTGEGAVGEDLGGDHLLPGVVETHTDHLEYHAHPRPGVRWDALPAVLASDAQLAGAGATTVYDAVRIGTPPGKLDDDTLLGRSYADAIEHAAEAGLLRADHAIHLRCEVSASNALSAYELFADDPHVRLMSLMDHTPGQRQFADVEEFKRYYVGKGTLSADTVDEYIAGLAELAAEFADPNREALAAAARDRGAVLAAHDDATVEHVEQSAALGVHIAEFPTTVVAARAADAHGQRIVMGAPNIVRGGSQSGNVAAAELLALGLLHILSSDYVPSSPLQAIFQLDHDGALPLSDGVKLVSGNPAEALGLSDRGRIEPGRRADLVRVHAHEAPADELRPGGRRVPVVRGVYRTGIRVA
jgi:alpha-D-ribose 1-methylphosphonate 5-triphosphate diphosphatase